MLFIINTKPLFILRWKLNGEGSTRTISKHLGQYCALFVWKNKFQACGRQKRIWTTKVMSLREEKNVERTYKTKDFTTCYWADDSM